MQNAASKHAICHCGQRYIRDDGLSLAARLGRVWFWTIRIDHDGFKHGQEQRIKAGLPGGGRGNGYSACQQSPL